MIGHTTVVGDCLEKKSFRQEWLRNKKEMPRFRLVLDLNPNIFWVVG